MMFTRLSASLSTVALTVALGFAAIPAASAAGEEPLKPVITASPATCELKENRLSLSNLTTPSTQYRLILEVDGKPERQIPKAHIPTLAQGPVSIEKKIPTSLLAKYYGKQVTVKAYWFHPKDGGTYSYPKSQQVSINTESGESILTKATFLSSSETVTLVNPASLDCQPPAQPQSPKKGADQLPPAPAFALAAAQCEAGKVVDNAMTITGEKKDNYRFVATQGPKSISLKTELRDKLWENGTLTAADIQAAYPTFTFDYSQAISVQAYWFDKDSEFNANLYDTDLTLAAGNSDRFIKLGEAKTLTLVDPASLNCAPAKPETPKVSIGTATEDGIRPVLLAGAAVATPVVAEGFTPEGKVLVEIHSNPVTIGTFTADAKGVVAFGLKVPATVPAGKHALVLTDQTTKRVVKADITVIARPAVTPAPGPKAPGDKNDAGGNTGSDQQGNGKKDADKQQSDTKDADKSSIDKKDAGKQESGKKAADTTQSGKAAAISKTSTLAKTGFEADLLAVAGLLTVGAGAAGVLTLRARARK